MSKHNFYIDHKFTVWAREYHSIEAESVEDAIEKVKISFKENVLLDNSLLDSSYEFETLLDTMESIGVEDNNGFATSELFFNGELIIDNRPVEVVREETLNKILNEK